MVICQVKNFMAIYLALGVFFHITIASVLKELVNVDYFEWLRHSYSFSWVSSLFIHRCRRQKGRCQKTLMPEPWLLKLSQYLSSEFQQQV
jgi:hypothetical protein